MGDFLNVFLSSAKHGAIATVTMVNRTPGAVGNDGPFLLPSGRTR